MTSQLCLNCLSCNIQHTVCFTYNKENPLTRRHRKHASDFASVKKWPRVTTCFPLSDRTPSGWQSAPRWPRPSPRPWCQWPRPASWRRGCPSPPCPQHTTQVNRKNSHFERYMMCISATSAGRGLSCPTYQIVCIGCSYFFLLDYQLTSADITTLHALTSPGGLLPTSVATWQQQQPVVSQQPQQQTQQQQINLASLSNLV